MNDFKLIIFIFATLTLVACGEYTPSNSSLPITSTSTNGATKISKINSTQKLNIDSGFVIIDTNNNGVRDDIDELIKSKYTVPTDISAATQYAKAAQMGVAAPSPAVSNISGIFKASMEATACAVGQMGIAGAGVMINDVHEATVNTKDRLMAYRETESATSGQTWVATEAGPKTFCKK